MARKKNNAFIFTTDSFLVLPLIILAVSTFISFSVTLRENTIQHEYAYMLARDSMNYLSELTMEGAGISMSNSTVLDTVVYDVMAGHLDDANSTIAASLDSHMPLSTGYVVEYKDLSSGDWVQVRRAGNQAKLSKPIIQVSELRIITALTQPSISYSSNCAQDTMCAASATRYVAGQVVGPLVLRIRVFT
ncbi:Uncharacterised protein [uncultured archaeon]|nr:Uncharacterised protein [uncultured archaeon]